MNAGLPLSSPMSKTATESHFLHAASPATIGDHLEQPKERNRGYQLEGTSRTRQ